MHFCSSYLVPCAIRSRRRLMPQWRRVFATVRTPPNLVVGRGPSEKAVCGPGG